MVRLLSLVTVLLPLAALARDGDEADRAREARVVRAAREYGPSVVCVHVSRSDAYHKAAWGTPANPEYPGALGRFDAAAAAKSVADSPRRERLLRDIADHDLSDAAVVPESFGSGFVIDKGGMV